ncbi:hypothetical protein [Chryseobacterium sp. CH21]|uniref:hypothetical protein n=1 Tax=Chryseobacterium sp. CH21 TaxID=713556 RepID=UPI0013E95E3B|nr:hypothetical protein [Chryseobacterium sp. CH21]
MFVDEGFEVIYLNYKIKKTVPYIKNLTPKDNKEEIGLKKIELQYNFCIGFFSLP